MKTKIINPFGCFVLFLLITNVLFSQAPVKKNYLVNVVAMSVDDARIISNSTDAPIRINGKIQRSFTEAFGGITRQKWSMAGKNYHCSFYMNGIPTNVLYNKNGNVIYLIRYGKEKNMPSDIRKIVKGKYYDYTILAAIEVQQNNQDIWIVNMSEDSNHITVRIEDEEMEVVQQFKTPEGI